MKMGAFLFNKMLDYGHVFSLLTFCLSPFWILVQKKRWVVSSRRQGPESPEHVTSFFPPTSPPPLPIPFNFVNSQLLPLLILLEHPPCPPAPHLSPAHCPSCHYSRVHLVLITSWARSVSSTFSHRQRRNNWSSSDWNVSSFYLHGYSSTWKLNIHLEEIISSWSKVL